MAAPGSAIGPELARRYEVLGELGRGGIGVVLRARPRGGGPEVALKLLLVRPDRTRLERFRREGEVTARLVHPGIVRIHDAGDADGLPFLAYELVDGARPLDRAAAELPVAERVALVRDAARALGFAHARGVVHRDVKPENLLVDADGRARVADFGLAMVEDKERLTVSGAALGTPAFMAPEQVRGDRAAIGPPADVWALGAVLYRVLAGTEPFAGCSSVQELVGAILTADPTPLRELAPGTPRALEAVVGKAMAKDPAARYPDGEALARELERFLAGARVEAAPRRRVGRAALAAGLLLAAALGGAAALRAREAAAPTPVAAAPEGPALTLDQAAPEATWAAQVTLRVAVGGLTRGAVTVAARPDPGPDGAPAAPRPKGVRAREGDVVPLEVDLAPGRNALALVATDARGRAGPPLVVVVERLVGPAWFEALAPADRPACPLPAGVSFGEAPGEYVHARDGSRLVWVPPGTFPMGRADSSRPDESPVHEVTISRGFFLGRHEVTWGQWRRFCKAAGRAPPGEAPRTADGVLEGFTPTDDHPIYNVSWDDAQAYCAWAGLALPTEAEWEWAARGPKALRYPWGEEPGEDRHLNATGAEDGHAAIAPVGSYPAGASWCGALDMAGNVHEWVQDWMGPYGPAPARNPRGPAEGIARVMRGGGYLSGRGSCGGSRRFALGESSRAGELGFRVALRGP